MTWQLPLYASFAVIFKKEGLDQEEIKNNGKLSYMNKDVRLKLKTN